MYSGMYNKIFKNYQVNLGAPLQIKSNLNLKPVKEEKSSKAEDAVIDVEADIPVNEAEQAREEADLIIREARLEAQRILEDAEKEAQDSIDKIQEEAWRKGYEEGLSQGRTEYDSLIREAGEIRENAQTEYSEMISTIEERTVEVIIEVARKVIGNEITQNAGNILHLARQAFEKSENRENVVLRVSADDFDYITSEKDRLFSISDGVGEFEIKKDLSLKKGACILDTAFGSIDSGVQTRMKKIEEAFRAAIGK